MFPSTAGPGLKTNRLVVVTDGATCSTRWSQGTEISDLMPTIQAVQFCEDGTVKPLKTTDQEETSKAGFPLSHSHGGDGPIPSAEQIQNQARVLTYDWTKNRGQVTIAI